MDISVIWAAVGAVGSIGAASVAAWAAHQSRLSAGEANAAATALVAIERDRRHEELTPQFEIMCTVKAAASDSADLWVELTGGRLERHAAVSVTIQDESGQDHWGRGLPDGVRAEEAEAFVWGPWEFNTGASEQVVSNRQSRERPFDRVSGKNWELLSLTRTRPGRWMTGASQEQWRKQWRDKPVRLLLTCKCEGVSLFGPGFGECLALHLPGGKWILVDSCRDATGNPVGLEYLRSIGVNPATEVSTVVASHWHMDHVDGIAEVVAESGSAEPVVSAALYTRDLLAFAGAVQYLGISAPRAIVEFRRLAEALQSSPYRRPITLSQARMRLLNYSYGSMAVSVEALSPSSSSVAAAFEHLGRSALEAGQEVQTPRADYNSAALVLRVRADGIGVLLASDLEIHRDAQRGWRAVVEAAEDEGGPSQFIKIAHHGSANGDAEQIWSQLLCERPVAALTHFHNGSVHLPQARQLEVISSRCERLYSTSGEAWAPIPMTAAAAAQMLSEGRPLAVMPPELGHVRARIRPEEEAAWRLSVCGRASAIEVTTEEHINSRSPLQRPSEPAVDETTGSVNRPR